MFVSLLSFSQLYSQNTEEKQGRVTALSITVVGLQVKCEISVSSLKINLKSIGFRTIWGLKNYSMCWENIENP